MPVDASMSLSLSLIYIYIYIYIYGLCLYIHISKVADLSQKWPEGSFSIATMPRRRKGATSFPGLLHFTLDPYLIMLTVKQGEIKYHFLSLWYDSTWDWNQVSQAHWQTVYSLGQWPSMWTSMQRVGILVWMDVYSSIKRIAKQARDLGRF